MKNRYAKADSIRQLKQLFSLDCATAQSREERMNYSADYVKRYEELYKEEMG